MDLPSLLSLYRATLLEDVVPWWERHALADDGAVNTCIADDGTVLRRDRWCWSQWRAVWVFSRLYNAIAPEPRWIGTARRILAYLRAHGPLDNGHWPLLLDESGRVVRGYESIFTDGFAIYALVELWRAERDDRLLELALQTFRAAEPELEQEVLPPIFPYPAPPEPTARAHGLSMMFSLAFHELAQATGDPRVRAAADRHHRRVMELFLRPDRGLVLEWVRPDGGEYSPPGGTAMLPGHAVESMWFQMHIARDAHDSRTLDRAVETIRRHLEIGWDDRYGGIYYAVDADGREEVGWPYADTKLWWPHTECLYGTLLAYEHSGRPWCLDWHERIREYSFARYPVRPHGEWRQRLDRQGRPISDVVALPVKDPFHLPRALIHCIEVLERLTRRPRRV